jgi:hypothetical protein
MYALIAAFVLLFLYIGWILVRLNAIETAIESLDDDIAKIRTKIE